MYLFFITDIKAVHGTQSVHEIFNYSHYSSENTQTFTIHLLLQL